MKFKSPVRLSGCLLVAGLSSLLVMDAHAQRQMEKLGRGVVALHSATSQAYVGWRLLAPWSKPWHIPSAGDPLYSTGGEQPIPLTPGSTSTVRPVAARA